MPDDLSEFVAQKHNGLHQTTEVLVEVKPNCNSQYNIEANSEHNIAHHSSLSSVRHQNHDSLDLDNSVSPNLKQTQAISNAHLTTFLHSQQATIDFSQTLNLSKAHFTPHLIKTISYFSCPHHIVTRTHIIRRGSFGFSNTDVCSDSIAPIRSGHCRVNRFESE